MPRKKLKVFEAFAGIGAQASALKRLNIDYEIVGIASEQLNRKCCAIELEPKYCDVIVRRFKELCPAAEIKHIRDGVEIYD